MKRAVLLVGHGSKLAGFNEAMDQVIDSLRKKEPAIFFLPAFLELQSPNIPQGIERCIQEGADEITVIPYFVQTGRHVVEHIPQIVKEAQASHPDVKISLGEYLGFDERIVAVIQDKIRKASLR